MVVIISSSVCLFILEIFSQQFGIKESYTEKRNGQRQLDVNYVPGEFYPWLPDSTHSLKNNEFEFVRKTNSLGLSDVEWKLTKDKFRILALGDSFTEGDGSPADSTWVALIKQIAENDSVSSEWMNAGICGSDPYYEYQLLKDRLLVYQPDLVIIAIQDQDFLQDILLKGGSERWERADKTNVSLFEMIYAYSRISRLITENMLGYNELLVRSDKASIEKIKNKYIPEVIGLFSDLSSKHHFPVIFVYFPSRYGIVNGVHQFGLGKYFVDSANPGTGLLAYDLLSCYQDYIRQSGKDFNSFWWSQDGHHNGKGYEMMAHCIYYAINNTRIYNYE